MFRVQGFRSYVPLLLLFLMASTTTSAGYGRAAVEDELRPESDRARDADRKPAEVLDFFGIEPGMRVVDLQATRGYYTELLSAVVGPEGKVYAHNNSFVLNRFAEKPLAERIERLKTAGRTNIERIDAELDELGLPDDLDVAFFVRFYHDLFWLPTPDGDKADRGTFLAQIFAALKPGGVFGVIDHHAEAGSGDRDALDPREGLHRIDVELVKKEILAAGFVLDAESDLLANPEDTRDWNIFVDNGTKRDKTDRFVLRFVKPEPGKAFLPPQLSWEGRSRELIVSADDPWITPSERTGLTETPRYDETMAWLARLVEASPRLHWLSLGNSAEGREIRMVVASSSGAKTAGELRVNGKPTLLAHAGIHAGEIDGKDAGLMLLRDMTVGKRKTALLDDANFLFIPILNVDGHERFSAYSRMNQRGPREMGWRNNRRNLNLNRDFAKLETEELGALAAMIREWQPDLYLDLHVTDGADYQYDITFGYNGRHAWSPNIARWLDDVLTPAIQRDLTRMGHVPGPLVLPIDHSNMQGGNIVWTTGPRFSNGWGDLRHLPTVLVENHSLKPYDQRVLGTYLFLETALKTLAADGDELRRATAADRAARNEEVALGWQFNRAAGSTTYAFKGVRFETYPSAITGQPNLRWTGEKTDLEIPFFEMSQATTSVRRPARYYVPAAWSPIVETLERQGIRVERLGETSTIEVERYRLPDATLDADASPFEGRTLYKPGVPVVEHVNVELRAGSFVVSTDQALGMLAVVLLEPQAPDSLFQWGYFSEILQRTEYFEDYVMEPMAQAMLDADPALRADFAAKLEADTVFADDAQARLRWFYEKTPFYDEEYRVYPVYRSLD